MSACVGAEEFVRGGISFFDLKNGTNYTPILPCSQRVVESADCSPIALRYWQQAGARQGGLGSVLAPLAG